MQGFGVFIGFFIFLGILSFGGATLTDNSDEKKSDDQDRVSSISNKKTTLTKSNPTISKAEAERKLENIFAKVMDKCLPADLNNQYKYFHENYLQEEVSH